MSSPTVISARNLTKRYGELVAVDGIDFDIRRGECFGFLGPNGAGKTSTMKMISCVAPVAGGELLVDGKDVTREQRAIKTITSVIRTISTRVAKILIDGTCAMAPVMGIQLLPEISTHQSRGFAVPHGVPHILEAFIEARPGIPIYC